MYRPYDDILTKLQPADSCSPFFRAVRRDQRRRRWRKLPSIACGKYKVSATSSKVDTLGRRTNITTCTVSRFRMMHTGFFGGA